MGPLEGNQDALDRVAPEGEGPSLLDQVDPDLAAPIDRRTNPLDDLDAAESDEEEAEELDDSDIEEVLNADPDDLPVADSDDDLGEDDPTEEEEVLEVEDEDILADDAVPPPPPEAPADGDAPPPPPPPEGPEVADEAHEGDEAEREDAVAERLADGVDPNAPDEENPASNDVSLEADPEQVVEPEAPVVSSAPSEDPPTVEGTPAEVGEIVMTEPVAEPPAVVDASAPTVTPITPVAPVVEPPVAPVPQLQAPIPTAGDDFVEEVFAAYSGMTPEEHQQVTAAALADLSSFVDGKKTSLIASNSPLLTGVDAAVDGLVGQIQGQVSAAEATIRGGFATARQTVEGQAATAIAQVDTAAQQAIAAIDAKLGTRAGELDAVFTNADNTLTGAASVATNAFSTAFAAKVAEIRQLGETRAAEAMATANAKANAYGGASADDSLEGRRKKARSEAAKKVGEDYAAAMRANAAKMADEVAKGTRNIPNIISQITRPIKEELSRAKGTAAQGLRDVANGAKTTVNTQKDDAKQKLEKSKSDNVAMLTRQEETSVTDLQSLGRTAESNLRDAGTALKCKLNEAVEGVNREADVAMAWIRDQFAAAEPPNGPDAQAAVADFKAEFERIFGERLAALSAEQVAGIQKLNEQANTGKEAISAKATEAANKASEMGTEISTSFTESARLAATGLTQLATQTDTAMGEHITRTRTSVEQAITNARTMYQTAQTDTMAQLDIVKTSANTKLGEALAKLPADIESEAQKAADKIQPWYKKAIAAVIGIVVTIVVVVAVAAFCVATLGTGAIVAGIIAGAVGALAGALATDAVMSLLTWSNQFKSFKEYAVVFIMGGVMGGIGAWVGPLAQPLSVAAKFGVAGAVSLFGSLMKQGLDALILGEKWDWGEFLFGTIVGTITGGLASNFSSTIGAKFSERILGQQQGQWSNFQRAANAIGISTDDAAQQAAILDVFSGQLGESPTALGSEVTKAITEDVTGRNVDSQDVRNPQPLVDVKVDTSGIRAPI